MKSVILGLRRLLDYMSSLGIVEGLFIFVRVYLPLGHCRLSLSTLPHPISLRRGTADRHVFEHIFIRGGYQTSLLKDNPKVIVDGGANIGLSSIAFSLAYPSARVVAIEPDPGNFEMLKLNCAEYQNIEPLFGALWSSNKPVTINNPGSSTQSYRITEDITESQSTLPSISMMDVIGKVGGRVDLLKLDIEGAELQLFSSAPSDWIDRVDAFAIEVHDRIVPGASMAIYRAISNWTFDQYIQGETLWIIRREHSNGENGN